MNNLNVLFNEGNINMYFNEGNINMSDIKIVFKDNKLSIVNELNYEISFKGLTSRLIDFDDGEDCILKESIHNFCFFDITSLSLIKGNIRVVIIGKYYRKLLKCNNKKSALETLKKLEDYVNKRYKTFKKRVKNKNETSFEIKI